MKKTKKIAIIFAILVIIASVAFGAVYYFTDMFKTPQQAFYLYLDKAAKLDNSYTYQDMLDELQVAKTKSYKAETTMGVDFNIKGYESTEAQQLSEVLKNLKLKINTEAKPSEKKSTSNLSLNFGGLSAGGLKVVRDNDIYGIKSDLLDNKYLAVENRNLKDLMRKLGQDASQVPNKIEELDIYDLLYVSKEDQEKLKNTYKNIFKDGIPADKYTKQENVNQKINGEDVNTKEYKLTLDETDFLNVITKLLETVKEDDTLLNLLVEKMNFIIDNPAFEKIETSADYSLKNSAPISKSKSIMQKLTKSDLKDVVNEILNELKLEQKYAGSSKAEFIIYVNNNDVAKIEVKNSDETVLAIEFFKKDDKKHLVVYIPETDKYTGRFSYETIKRNKRELQKIIEIEYKTSCFGDKTTSEGSFTLFNYEEKVAKIGFDVTSTGKVGNGKNETTAKISLEVDEMYVAFNVDSTVEFTDNVSVESLNDRNANILNNMSEKEIQNYFENLTKGLENTLSMFGMKSNTLFPTNSQKTKIETDLMEKQQEAENTAKDMQEEIKNKAKELQKDITDSAKEAQGEIKEKSQEVQEDVKKSTQKEIEELQKQLEEKMKELKENNI